MRYFPKRVRRKSNIGAKLNVCTYCLGDLFADGRCVQCQAVIASGSVRQPMPSPPMIAPIAHREPLLN